MFGIASNESALSYSNKYILLVTLGLRSSLLAIMCSQHLNYNCMELWQWVYLKLWVRCSIKNSGKCSQACTYVDGRYVERNFQRWLKQYEASKTDDVAEINSLITWIQQHMPKTERCTLIHGDFRLVYH